MQPSLALPRVSITLEQCAKTFHHQRVLAPLDLHIAAGETLVLLGPSGCGKTTTLRMIAGLERPDAGGRVLFDGEDVTMLPIERRQVGMVFQSYALFPNMSVRENVAYGLRIQKSRGKPDVRGTPLTQAMIDARVQRLLALTELSAHADKRIDALSGGQRQRVALARTLAPQPRVLLLDEPLTALDARLRETLRTEMNDLLRSLGVTTVYVTHDQAEAMALGDRIVVMSAGRVEQAGTPREIYYRPATRHVAEFVGTMNRVRGRVRNGRFWLADRPVALPLVTRHDDPAASIVSTGDQEREAFFRPEDAMLCTPEQAHISGVLRTATFLGERTRLIVETLDGNTLTLDISGRHPVAVGDTLPIRLRDDALMLLDTEKHGEQV